MIGMEPLELAIRRIVDVYPEFAKKRPLGQQRVSHRPAAAEDRGIPKTHIKAQNCAGPDVDQQGKPGTGKLFAMQTVDEDHIGAGMIHLHEVEQPGEDRVAAVERGRPFVHRNAVVAVAFSGDSELLATGGYDNDARKYAKTSWLTAAVYDWGPYYLKRVKAAMDGSWKTERSVWGVKEGQNALAKIADFVPEAAKKKVEEIKAGALV